MCHDRFTVCRLNRRDQGKFDSLGVRRTNSQAGWIISFILSKLTFRCAVSDGVLCILVRICLNQITSNVQILYELFLYDLCSFVRLVYDVVFYDKSLPFSKKILAGFSLECRKILYLIFRFIQALQNFNLVERDHS